MSNGSGEEEGFTRKEGSGMLGFAGVFVLVCARSGALDGKLDCMRM